MAAEPISILRRTLVFARSIAALYTRFPTLGSTDSISTNSLTWHNPPSDSLSDSNSPCTPAGRTNTDGGRFQEDIVMVVKLQYDAYNRTRYFTLNPEIFRTAPILGGRCWMLT